MVRGCGGPLIDRLLGVGFLNRLAEVSANPLYRVVDLFANLLGVDFQRLTIVRHGDNLTRGVEDLFQNALLKHLRAGRVYPMKP